MAQLAWFVLAILASSYVCEAYKVLLVTPFPGKSHSILAEGYTRLLLNAGHEVTIITPFPRNDPPPNLKQLDVSTNVETFPTQMINLKLILEKKEDPTDLTAFFDILLNLSNNTFTNPNVQKVLNDPSQKFDVIIIEWLFSELGAALSVVYDCPFIWFSTVEPHWLVLRLIDEGLNPSYNPDAISANIPPFNFKQRLQELGMMIMSTIFRALFFSNRENVLYNEIFGPILANRGKPMPSYYDVIYNASLMFGNSHVSLGQATRLPQNYKAIAGYHIDPDVKPLPDDLKIIMDNAKEGVIYFSLGSNLKSKHMPDELKREILKMFGGLKYTVLWKFEEDLPDLPKNVHILNWAPQPSILAHPKCILFITHGGLLSTTEALHFGVPLVGIPVFADQFVNVDRAVKRGFAKRVDLSYNMAYEMKIAIVDVLGDSKYREKAKELSLIYHDRPVSPGAELVHWVQHVVRTRGAPHLRSPALHVPLYQKLYLDLIGLIIVALFVLKKVLYRCTRLFFSKKKRDNTKKNN